jgi:hypothetical protein
MTLTANRYTLTVLAMLALTACTTDSYEKGEGKYSLMQAEMVELSVDGKKQATAFVLDDDSHFTLTSPATASWIQKADTTYRAILYFNKLTETTAECVQMGAVPTLRPVEHWKMKELPQDPVGFESAWLSKKGKYLNVGLLLKTGQVDGEDGIHTVGIAQDTILVNADNTRTAYYRFLHDQGGVPEYYTNRRYISILLPSDQSLDTIRLTIPTYEGMKERAFRVRLLFVP